MAHKWTGWLHYRCCIRCHQGFRAGDNIRTGPQVRQIATQPLPPMGSPTLQSRRGNQKYITSGPGGYITIASREVHKAWKRSTKSKMAHQRAGRLHNEYRFWETIRSGPQVVKLATLAQPNGGSPKVQSGNQIKNGTKLDRVATSTLLPWRYNVMQRMFKQNAGTGDATAGPPEHSTPTKTREETSRPCERPSRRSKQRNRGTTA